MKRSCYRTAGIARGSDEDNAGVRPRRGRPVAVALDTLGNKAGSHIFERSGRAVVELEDGGRAEPGTVFHGDDG